MQTIEVKRETKGDSVALAMFWCGVLIFGMIAMSGCMQITGAKKIDAWGLVIEANNGFDISAGVQQYDNVQNMKGINNTNTTVTRGVK
jgi:hypothetical protein